MAKANKVKCEGCEKGFEQNTGRGRPRKYCKTCRPVRARKAK